MVKFAALTALFALASAQDDSPGDGARKFSAIVDMVMDQITTAHDAGVISKMIQNYGCHCFPGYTRSTGGLGAPVDDLDSQCRTLYRCKKCVNLEFPGLCDADQGKYKYDIGAGGIDCSANTEACKMAQCQCDKEFAEQLGGMWDDNAFENKYWLNTKNVNALTNAGETVFDYDGTCVATGANVVPDACCGDNFPSKIPYNTGSRGCCAVSSRTYNAALEECCADGSIKAPGTC